MSNHKQLTDAVNTNGLSLANISFLKKGPFSLVIEPGSCVGLTGVSGVGKTQLLRAVADLIVHDGTCSLDGVPCASIEPTKWRRQVAMIPAESFWWHDSVGDHFSDGIRNFETMPEDSAQLFTALGFSSEIMDWQISRLSTGERQRLSLIRTLITKPRVLLLDEPTASLDRDMVYVVEKIITRRCDSDGIACLWISHDREQLSRVADMVYRMEPNGLVREDN